MKPRAYLPAVVCLALCLLTIVLSWLLNAYDVEVVRPTDGEVVRVRSLISGEGIRWMLTHAVSDFARFPLTGIGTVALMAVGLSVDSGMVGAVARRLRRRKTESRPSGTSTHKEVRGLRAALGLLLTVVVVVALLTVGPNAILRGVDGSLWRSPLTASLCYMLVLTLSLMAAVYGLVTGRYRSANDVVGGMAHLSAYIAWYLITLFFLSTLIGCVGHALG